MILTGAGLYMAYTPFNAMLFDRDDRLLFSGRVGTAGFPIYVADASGYLGKRRLAGLAQSPPWSTLDWLLGFFVNCTYATSVVGAVCTALGRCVLSCVGARRRARVRRLRRRPGRRAPRTAILKTSLRSGRGRRGASWAWLHALVPPPRAWASASSVIDRDAQANGYFGAQLRLRVTVDGQARGRGGAARRRPAEVWNGGRRPGRDRDPAARPDHGRPTAECQLSAVLEAFLQTEMAEAAAPGARRATFRAIGLPGQAEPPWRPDQHRGRPARRVPARPSRAWLPSSAGRGARVLSSSPARQAAAVCAAAGDGEQAGGRPRPQASPARRRQRSWSVPGEDDLITLFPNPFRRGRGDARRKLQDAASGRSGLAAAPPR
ncbi:DUF5690 family protein [Caulobacter segnis]